MKLLFERLATAALTLVLINVALAGCRSDDGGPEPFTPDARSVVPGLDPNEPLHGVLSVTDARVDGFPNPGLLYQAYFFEPEARNERAEWYAASSVQLNGNTLPWDDAQKMHEASGADFELTEGEDLNWSVTPAEGAAFAATHGPLPAVPTANFVPQTVPGEGAGLTVTFSELPDNAQFAFVSITDSLGKTVFSDPEPRQTYDFAASELDSLVRGGDWTVSLHAGNYQAFERDGKTYYTMTRVANLLTLKP